ACGGTAINASDIDPDVQGHYGDGMNAHVAYEGRPSTREDSLGLSHDDDIVNNTFEPYFNIAQGVLDYLNLRSPLPTAGTYIASVAQSLGSDYAANLLRDTEWA